MSEKEKADVVNGLSMVCRQYLAELQVGKGKALVGDAIMTENMHGDGLSVCK